MVIDVLPSELEEVISVTPAIWPSCRSSGVATDDAIMSALAPGKPALTEIVGKSTSGKGATGSTSNAIAPARATATVSSVVATGRLMKGAEMFMPAPPVLRLRFRRDSTFSQTGAPDCQRKHKSLASYKA